MNIPCGHPGCGHKSSTHENHLDHGSLHFTASVMGNPEYLDSVKDIVQAKDQRMEGIERVNAGHAAAHEERVLREIPKWSR